MCVTCCCRCRKFEFGADFDCDVWGMARVTLKMAARDCKVTRKVLHLQRAVAISHEKCYICSAQLQCHTKSVTFAARSCNVTRKVLHLQCVVHIIVGSGTHTCTSARPTASSREWNT